MPIINCPSCKQELFVLTGTAPDFPLVCPECKHDFPYVIPEPIYAPKPVEPKEPDTTWEEDAREIVENDIWEFGNSDHTDVTDVRRSLDWDTSSPNVDKYTSMSYVNRSWFEKEGCEKITPLHVKGTANYGQCRDHGIRIYKRKVCPECLKKFLPNCPSKLCPECRHVKRLTRQAQQIAHNNNKK
jgi:hypothetical protein